jgi:putative hemolysin
MPHTSPVRLTASWCKTPEEIAEAQQLRYQVFVHEMGAHLPKAINGLDIDEFDPWCEQLVVRAGVDGPVVGTYRALMPEKASTLGKLYAENEFDLGSLKSLKPRLIELGRSCVHADYRSGSGIMALWSGLGELMLANGYEYLLGCASVPMDDGGAYAYSLYQQFKEQGVLCDEFNAKPLKALDTKGLTTVPGVKPPPLLKGYLRLGARICAAPAIDPEFNTADFLTLLRLSDLHPRYAKHFLTAS